MISINKFVLKTFLIGLVIFLFTDVCGCNKSDEITPKDNQEKDVERTLWLCPMPMDITRNRAIVSDYIQVLTHPEDYYPNVFKNTKVLKLYIEAINRFSIDDIRAIVEFTNKNDLEIAVEVGGIRMKIGQVANTQIGVKSAEYEMKSLNKLINAGGKINYISTDHSMASYLTGRKDDLDEFTHEEIMEQMMEYFKYIQERITGIKVGTIESLGYFWVSGNRQYQATDKSLNRLDFESFMDTYASVAERHGVVLDHFHIDFGMHDVQYDKGYGRIYAVESYLKSKNISLGFIAANAFHDGRKIPQTNLDGATKSAAENTVKYFEGYMKNGGKSDYLILQRWQPYPLLLGREKNPYSQMGIFNSILSSTLLIN